MATPSYGDLGKAARDLFTKGFNYGFFKMEAKTKTQSNVEFTANGNQNHDSGKVNGSLDTKYECSDYGMTFSEKWSTDNTLSTEVTVEDQLLEGLKLAFEAQFSPLSGKKNGKIKTSFKRDYLNTGCDVDFDFAGPTINGYIVGSYEGWLAGYQMAFDTSKSKLTSNNVAVGYKSKEFTLHTAVNDGTEFAGSVYQKVRNNVDMGVQLVWNTGSSNTRFGIAAKYSPDDQTTLRAKVNNYSQLGMSFQHKLKDGITLTLSSLIEGKNFNAGGHKIGLGLDFEA